MRVVVLADTHIREGSSRRLPQPAVDRLREADVILHAGDIVSRGFLTELARYAPVHAVLGNNDHELVGDLPETVELELEGVRIAMVHDSGPRQGRPARLRRRFPDAELVVFGHSHIPVNEAGIAGQWLFNPGSPTERRRQPHHTLGVLELEDGRVVERRIEVVTQPAAD